MERSRITVFDTTLRDGEQSPGCSMNLDEKLRMARQLDRLGVDVIEAGFPIASQGDFEAVEAIAQEIRRPIIAGLARCHASRYRARLGCGSSCRAAAHSRLSGHLRYPPSLQVEDEPRAVHPPGRASRSSCAHSLCADVEFSPEDATRTELEFLCSVVEAVVEAGATTVNIPDTVGYTVPDEMRSIIQAVTRVSTRCSRKAVISAHCHNDLGLGRGQLHRRSRGGCAPGRMHHQRHRRARRQCFAGGIRDGTARTSGRDALRRRHQQRRAVSVQPPAHRDHARSGAAE